MYHGTFRPPPPSADISRARVLIDQMNEAFDKLEAANIPDHAKWEIQKDWEPEWMNYYYSSCPECPGRVSPARFSRLSKYMTTGEKVMVVLGALGFVVGPRIGRVGPAAEFNAAEQRTLADTGAGTNATAGEVVGRRGAPIEIQAGRNAPATIGGRDFTGHALDRMQGRGLTPSVIENTIRTGQATAGNLPGTTKFFDPINNTTAILDTATGRVITVY